MSRLDPFLVPLAGLQLIEASAGTGKTYTLATLYLRLVLEQRRRVSDLLVVTYTVAATAELRARIRRRLWEAAEALRHDEAIDDPPGDPALAEVVARARAAGRVQADRDWLLEAVRSFDEAVIHTIHGFCQRVLHDNAFLSAAAFDPEFLADPSGMYARVAHEFWAERTYHAPAALVRHLQARRISVERLAGLVRRVVQNPDLVVLPRPERSGPLVLADAEQRFLAAHASAAAAWSSARAAVRDILERSLALNRSLYRPGSIARWCRDLDAVFAAPLPYVRVGAPCLDRLTPAGLRAGVKLGKTPPGHPFFEAVAGLLAADEALAAALDHEVSAWLVELADSARDRLARHMQRANLHSFDDLLQRVASALRGPEGGSLADWLRRRFPAALIDEFQDTDRVQYEIFRRAYQGSDAAVFLIGDPKQAIYGFRGADLFAYLDAKRDAGGRAHTLDVNRRTDPSLLRALNALYARSASPFLFDAIDAVPATPPPEAIDRLCGAGAACRLLWVSGEPAGDERAAGALRLEDRMVTGVAADIVRLLGSGATIDGHGVSPSDVAILTRTNRQITLLQTQLRELGVPTVVHGDANVFDEPEAVELERILRAIARPQDPRARRAALTTVTLGVSAAELAALELDEPAWETWAEGFLRWHMTWQSRGFVQSFRQWLEELHVQRRLLGYRDGERRLTNLLHLGELLQTAAVDLRLGMEPLLAWLGRMRSEPPARAELAEDSARLRLESDEDAVTLVTIHKSKGLEYPIVYCPFLWERVLLHADEGDWVRYHDADGRLCLDLGSADREAHRRAALRELLAEGLRVAYVALTRARHQVNLVWGDLRGVEESALATLVHAPPARTVFDAPGARDPVEAMRARLTILDDAGRRRDLSTWVEAAAGAVEIVDLLAIAPTRHVSTPTPARALRGPRERRRLELVSRWVSSFTRMTAAEETAEVLYAEELDVDRGTGARPHPEPVDEPVAWAGLPAGAATGLAIHKVLEHLDFAGDPAQWSPLLDTALLRLGLGETAKPALERGLARALAAPLRPEVFALRDLPAADRLHEIAFTLPVRSESEGLWPREIADVLAPTRDEPLLEAYANAARHLTFPPLRGFLNGAIDLVFRREGRWYVVDYKSNDLGPHPRHYASAALQEAMIEHHYVLQLYLYVLALHRFLGQRLPDYRYERDFGGAYFLFLRGLGHGEPGTGIVHHRPSAARIERLSTTLRSAP